MPVKTHTCVTVVCDLCKYAYDEDEYVAHFPSLDDARKILHSQGWTITADRKVFCTSGDADHQAALDALMPPEPTVQCDGQVALDTDGPAACL